MEVNTERRDAGFYELIIPEVEKRDAGMYSCTASNKYGEASCEAIMSVCGKTGGYHLSHFYSCPLPTLTLYVITLICRRQRYFRLSERPHSA